MFLREELEGCARAAADFGFSVSGCEVRGEREARFLLETGAESIEVLVTPAGYQTRRGVYEEITQLMMAEVGGFPQAYAQALQRRLEQV